MWSWVAGTLATSPAGRVRCWCHACSMHAGVGTRRGDDGYKLLLHRLFFRGLRRGGPAHDLPHQHLRYAPLFSRRVSRRVILGLKTLSWVAWVVSLCRPQTFRAFAYAPRFRAFAPHFAHLLPNAQHTRDPALNRGHALEASPTPLHSLVVRGALCRRPDVSASGHGSLPWGPNCRSRRRPSWSHPRRGGIEERRGRRRRKHR